MKSEKYQKRMVNLLDALSNILKYAFVIGPLALLFIMAAGWLATLVYTIVKE